MERGIVGERTRAALSHKKLKGERIGNIPYGYRLAEDGKCLVADAYEQDLIVRAKSYHDKGLSLRRIGAALEADGYTARNGGGFKAMQVSKILGA